MHSHRSSWGPPSQWVPGLLDPHMLRLCSSKHASSPAQSPLLPSSEADSTCILQDCTEWPMHKHVVLT